MRLRLLLPWLALAAFATAPSALAIDRVATITVTGAFSSANTTGGPTPIYCGGPGQAACSTFGLATPPSIQARWGDPVGTNDAPSFRSGLGFEPSGGTIDLNRNVSLGALTHFNFPIFNGATEATLTVVLGADTPDGTVLFTLPFTIGIDETPNAGRLADCEYPSVVVCADALSLPGGSASQAISTGGRTYTLTVLGFTDDPASTTPLPALVTQEGDEAQGFLVAQLARENTPPAAADDSFAAVSGGSVSGNVLANDTDADGDAFAAVLESGPAGGTLTLNPDGSFTYAAAPSFAGTDTFTYRADDGFEASAPATVTIAVTDTTPPLVEIAEAPLLTVEALDASGAPASFSASALDAVDGVLAASCEPASGSTFALGETEVTCGAIDAAGNAGSATLTVRVADTTAPTLTMPADFSVEAGAGGVAPADYPLPTATDAVDPSPQISCTPPQGAPLALGSNTIACAAVDASGNASHGSLQIDVVDTTAPTLVVPDDVEVLAESAGGAVVVFAATADDLVDASPTVSCSPASGSTFPIGTTTVVCTATDASSNSATASFDVTVLDVLAQLDALIDLSTGVPPGRSLEMKARNAKANLEAGDVAETCDLLGAFAREVRAQRGKKIPVATADDLLARATRISTLLGC